MKPQRVYQRLRADNDPNGNPQRLWIVYDVSTDGAGDEVEVYDEAYRGKPREALAGMIELPSVDISKSDYHARKRDARERGILR